jgi:hypothetical protein
MELTNLHETRQVKSIFRLQRHQVLSIQVHLRLSAENNHTSHSMQCWTTHKDRAVTKIRVLATNSNRMLSLQRKFTLDKYSTHGSLTPIITGTLTVQ